MGLWEGFEEGIGSLKELQVAEGMVKDFRMWWGNFDWARASSDCVSVFGLELRCCTEICVALPSCDYIDFREGALCALGAGVWSEWGAS